MTMSTFCSRIFIIISSLQSVTVLCFVLREGGREGGGLLSKLSPHMLKAYCCQQMLYTGAAERVEREEGVRGCCDDERCHVGEVQIINIIITISPLIVSKCKLHCRAGGSDISDNYSLTALPNRC